MINHTGIIQTLLSGESGKCWNPPVTDPIAIARIAQTKIIFQEFCFSDHSSRSDQITKNITPSTHVMSDRVPEKNPWDIAPVMKLIPR